MKEKVLTLDYLPDSLKPAIEDIKTNKVRYILEYNGEAQAILISLEEYEDLLEELALLTDQKHISMISEAREEYQHTGGISFEDYLARRKQDG
ncbi:MAG: hypothetical protein ACUVV0_04600 [Anaerolineae bacterium]